MTITASATRRAFRARVRVAGAPRGLASRYRYLFDSAYYTHRYPDVAATGQDPFDHYVLYGAREGRWPNRLFDPAYYEARCPEAASSGLTPALHYLRYGRVNLVSPHPLFDASAYVARYRDAHLSSLTPLEHYLVTGGKAGHVPHLLFDPEYYLDRVDGPGLGSLTPLEHYVEFGIGSRVSTHRLFDADYYVSAYPDVAASGLAPLEHYARIGVEEGRAVRPLVRPVTEGAPGWAEPWYRVSLPSPLGGVVEEVAAVVAEHGIQLVTLDLWDTLLVRSRPADSSKLALCQELARRLRRSPDEDPLDLYRIRQEVEHEIAERNRPRSDVWGEYELRDVIDGMLARLVTDTGPAGRSSLRDELAEFEIADEIRFTRPAPGAEALLARLRGLGVRTVVLSDFYLRAEDLRRIARRVGLDLDGVDVIVSCETGASKASGDAFGSVRQRYGVDGSGHLHVGDHPVSDGERARESGGSAIVVPAVRVGAPPGALLDAAPAVVAEPLRFSTGSGACFARRLGGQRDSADALALQSAAARSAGVLVAPIAVGLVAGAIEEARRRGLSTVHYLSREGQVFERVHRAVASILSDEPIGARHLAVSRRSTFGPSLDSLESDELMRLWRMYPNQSLAAFAASIGAPSSLLRVGVERGLDPGSPIPEIWRDPRVRDLLDSDPVREAVLEQIRRDRQVLRSYLDSVVDFGSGEAVVVDVGWRGSIQDNLARVLPDITWIGWYVALLEFLNPQPANSIKRAVGPNANLGDDAVSILEPVHVLELALSSQLPTVIGYTMQDGVGQPLFAPTDERGVGGHLADELQKGMMLAVRSIAEQIRGHGNAITLFRGAFFDLIDGLVHDPPPGLADLVSESDHDESFGVLNELPYSQARLGSHSLDGMASTEALESLRFAASGSRWPEGFMRWLPVRTLRANLGEEVF